MEIVEQIGVLHSAAPRADEPARFTTGPPTLVQDLGLCHRTGMCRNIRPLYNFEPHATPEEVHAAALQYVRKVSGMTKPAEKNKEAFDPAVAEIAHVTEHLLADLVTSAPPKDRDVEAEKARARNAQRFGAPVAS